MAGYPPSIAALGLAIDPSGRHALTFGRPRAADTPAFALLARCIGIVHTGTALGAAGHRGTPWCVRPMRQTKWLMMVLEPFRKKSYS